MKIAVMILLFLAVSVVIAFGEESNDSLVLRISQKNINTFGGVLFNDYPITDFELNYIKEGDRIDIFVNPYVFFRSNDTWFYTEYGLFAGISIKADSFDLTINPLVVGWSKKGRKDWGFVPMAELKFNTILNPKIQYAVSKIINREDLNGSFLKFDVGGNIGTVKKKGDGDIVIEATQGLVYNNHLFRPEEGFVFVSDIRAKGIRITSRLSADVFLDWTYAGNIINELMIGINIDFMIF